VLLQLQGCRACSLWQATLPWGSGELALICVSIPQFWHSPGRRLQQLVKKNSRTGAALAAAREHPRAPQGVQLHVQSLLLLLLLLMVGVVSHCCHCLVAAEMAGEVAGIHLHLNGAGSHWARSKTSCSRQWASIRSSQAPQCSSCGRGTKRPLGGRMMRTSRSRMHGAHES
jgi:hypothetical protein